MFFENTTRGVLSVSLLCLQFCVIYAKTDADVVRWIKEGLTASGINADAIEVTFSNRSTYLGIQPSGVDRYTLEVGKKEKKHLKYALECVPTEPILNEYRYS